MKNKKLIISVLYLILSAVMLLSMIGCNAEVSAATVDLMEGITADHTDKKALDDNFISSQSDFSVELFKKSFNNSDNKNTLISPLSVSLALSMTANGAKGETLSEMEFLLGGDLKISDLNGYQRTYLANHNNKYMKTANAIWFRDCDRFNVNQNFLQTNANYYGAGVFKAPFDDSTINDINIWVNKNTDGLIEEMVNEIADDTIMYLLNAVSFEAEWQYKYTSKPIKSTFRSASGKVQTAFMMNSDESTYLDDGQAEGFIKPYKGGKYKFAALLPNEGISINDYISGLSGDSLLNTLKNRSTEDINVSIPKFSYDYSLNMSQILITDIPTAFNPNKADFSDLGTSENSIYIGEVLHKTNITVDTNGTKAASSTKVEMLNKMSAMPSKNVILNRPFVYMILDNDTDLPVFIGAVMDIE